MAADAGNNDDGRSGPGKSGDNARGKPQRPPVTIDLTAERVAAGQGESPSPAAAEAAPAEEAVRPSVASEQPPPRSANAATGGIGLDDGQRRTFVAGAAGGIVALVLVIVLQGLGILPAPGRAQANRALEEATAAAEATGALQREISALQAMAEGLPAARADLKEAGDRLTALESSVGGLAKAADVTAVAAEVATLKEQAASSVAAATPADIAALAERISKLEVAVASGAAGASADPTAAIESLTTQIATNSTDLKSLGERLAAAEAEIAELGRKPPVAGGEAAVRAIAITALRRAASGSEPFVTEIDMAASLGIAGPEINALRPFAERGVPDMASIAAEFPAVADSILSATAGADPNAGFLDRLVSGLGGLVSVRPAGPIAGSDPQAIVSRMVAAVAAGDLATALSERAALPEAGQSASAAWAAKASDRAALDRLVERVARAIDGMTG